jgi:adenylate cyclase
MTIEERVIVFVDVHNFSLAFEELLPGYEFLQEMYEKLGDVIVGHGGEIIKYLGDAILSVFPAGLEVEAVQCAQEMRSVFAEIVARRELPGEIELEAGIGVGPVVVAESGHRTLRQKDVFGEAVNHAARIGHYQGVAITEQVCERVRTTYQTQRLPDLEVKGLGKTLKVWAIVE